MAAHFARIAAEATAPVMIYNVVPWAYCSPQLLTRIITEVDNVIGVKQSSGDMKLLADLLLMLDGRGSIFSAVDALLYPSFVLGVDGAIAALLTAVPGLCVALWDAVERGDHSEALSLHKRLLRVWNAIEDRTCRQRQDSDGIAGTARRQMSRADAASSPAQHTAIRAALLEAQIIA